MILAAVYDGRDPEGQPVVRREPVPAEHLPQLLVYLESAPVVLAARSFDRDEFALDATQDVPLNFRTDGTWIWAGAVPHYLRKHGLPPEAGLVRHIVAGGCRVPEVSEAARDRAVATITG